MNSLKHESPPVLARTALWLCTMIWGGAFIFQKIAMPFIAPLLFNALRSLLGALFLWLFISLGCYYTKKSNTPSPTAVEIKTGAILGAIMFIALGLQQIGLVESTVSKACLITGLYVIFVPFVMRIFSPVHIVPWQFGVFALGVLGVFLLTTSANSLSIGAGDVWLFASVPFWAIQICYIGLYSRRGRALQIALVQLIMCSVLSAVASFLAAESWTWGSIQSTMPSLLYLGALSSGIAFTLQIYGQERVNPSVAVLILSCEALFGAWLGWYYLDEILSLRNLMGAVLIVLAILLVEFTNYLQQLARPSS